MIEININPVAFTIGPVSVGWYGIAIAVAVLVLIWFVLRGIRQENGLSPDIVVNAALVGIPSGIIVSRLLHVLDEWGYYSQHLDQVIGGSGLTIYGAVLGTTLGIWVYSRFKRFSFGRLADIAAPGIILAQAIGRVGCLLNGCCYGAETDIICGIVYTNPNSFGPIGVSVHPTQAYEIVFNLIVFGLLLRLRKRLQPDGSLFLIYLSLYSAWRIGIGFLRENTALIWGLNEAQIIGLLILAVALPWLGMKCRWVKRSQSPGH